MYKNKEGDTMGIEVVGSLLKSNDDSISGNKEDASSIVVKVHDIERQMLEGKLVLVGDDGVLVKPLYESLTVLDFGLMSHIAISIDHHVEVPNSCEGGVLGSVPEPFSLLVLRRLRSIFTSVYAAIQKLKKDSW
ncbi:hypothetical protein Tco_0077033 [Tanacetum coccineum]